MATQAVTLPDKLNERQKFTYTANNELDIYYDAAAIISTGRKVAAGEDVSVYQRLSTDNYGNMVMLSNNAGWIDLTKCVPKASQNIVTTTSGQSLDIVSINQLVKVSRDNTSVLVSPLNGASAVETLNTGDTFTANGCVTVDGITYYRRSTDNRWVNGMYLIKTTKADVNSENNKVTKPTTSSISDNVTVYNGYKAVTCYRGQALSTEPNTSAAKTENGSVSSNKTYSVSAEYDDGTNIWYYLADGTGWFCGKLGSENISNILGDCTEDGTSSTSYRITTSVRFRTQPNSDSVNNVYGSFSAGDTVRTTGATKSVTTSDGTVQQWIQCYGKDNNGNQVTGWICVSETTSDGTESQYATNDLLTVATPANLYKVNAITTGFSEPGGTAVSSYLVGDELTLTNESKTVDGETYYKTTDGTWVKMDGLTEYTSQMLAAKLAEENTSDAESLIALGEEVVDLDDYIEDFGRLSSLRVKDLYGVYGCPYQFMRTADVRLMVKNDSGEYEENNYGFGMTFAEKIISKIPMLLLQPGVPTFMGDTDSKTRKQGLIGTLTSYATGEDGFAGDFLNKETRFYTLEAQWAEYFNYVNPMCRAGAQFLGIADKQIAFGNANKKLGEFQWQDIYEQGNWFPQLFNVTDEIASCQSIAFYVSAEPTISESWSNSTQEPSIASTINSISQQAREVNYILGNLNAKAGGAFDDILANLGLGEEVNASNLKEQIEKLVSGSFLKNSAVGGIINSVGDMASGLIQGSKMIFPELWADSSYGTEYSVTMKFATPDADKLSWYLNVFVPMCHIVCFVAPRTLTSMNMFHSPFIVNASYKSMFSCPMGIITSLSFTKGAEASWTRDGLPTVVECSVTIKELYSAFAITSGQAKASDLGEGGGLVSNLFQDAFMNNSILMDWIANSCGINLNIPDIERDFKMYTSFKLNQVYGDTIKNWFDNAQAWVGKKVLKILNVFK